MKSVNLATVSDSFFLVRKAGTVDHLFLTSPCHPSLAVDTWCKSPSFFSEAARTDGMKVKGWAELAIFSWASSTTMLLKLKKEIKRALLDADVE